MVVPRWSPSTLASAALAVLLLPAFAPQAAGTIAEEAAVPIVVYSTGFETGAAGWTHRGVADEWELGAPTYQPVGAHSGSSAWSTDLDSTYEDPTYAVLSSPRIQLPDTPWIQLDFWHYADIDPYGGDRIDVDVNGVGVYAYSDAPNYFWTSWANPVLDLSRFAGQEIVLGFTIGVGNLDGYGGGSGWSVDDVRILAWDTSPYVYDFEAAGAQGWTHGTLQAGEDEWERGTPSHGVAGAHSGTKAWATDLDNTPIQSSWTWLRSPKLYLPEATVLQLSWWQHFAATDNGVVQIGNYPDSGNWETLATFTGYHAGWVRHAVDLTRYAGQEVYLQFYLWTDYSNTGSGWAVDDVAVVALPACGDGLDNDADLAGDYPADPGCRSFLDRSEDDPTLPCDDGVDNDGDLRADYPADHGCWSPSDETETGLLDACGDLVDNDLDGAADYPTDPGCSSPSDPSEDAAALPCDDGLDNDADGLADHPMDPSCSGPTDPSEGNDPSPAVRTLDNPDGSTTVYLDQDDDGRQDPGEPGVTTPASSGGGGLTERTLLHEEGLGVGPQPLPPAGAGGVPVPDVPAQPGQPVPDHGGAGPIATPGVGQPLGVLSTRDAGTSYCAYFTPEGGPEQLLACAGKAFLGPLDPVMPRGDTDLVFYDPDDVPATGPVTTPDVPPTGPVTTPDAPPVPVGSLGDSPAVTMDIDVSYTYKAGRLTPLVNVLGQQTWSPVAPTADDLAWLASPANPAALTVTITVYKDGVSQGTVRHGIPALGQVLAAAEMAAGTL